MYTHIYIRIHTYIYIYINTYKWTHRQTEGEVRQAEAVRLAQSSMEHARRSEACSMQGVVQSSM